MNEIAPGCAACFAISRMAEGRPARAVDRDKRRHIVRAAKEYLSAHPTKKQPRLDIIEVYLDPVNKRKRRIVQIENAFGDETR